VPVNKTVDISNIERVGDLNSLPSQTVVDELQTLFRRFQSARQPLEEYWRHYYESYMTTPEAVRSMLSTTAKRHIGDVNTTWHHRLKNPKAYQVVETVVSYMMGAFFPNERWFSLVPEEAIPDPRFQAIIELNRRLMSDKLEESRFESAFEIFLRELCIVGSCALMFPWVDTSPRFTVLSPFDYYLDPSGFDPNDSAFVRTYQLSEPELNDYIEKGLFDLANRSDFVESTSMDLFEQMMSDEVRRMAGLQDSPSRSTTQKNFTIYEFWGDLVVGKTMLKNVRASWTSEGVLLNLATNPYIERPFIIGSYLRIGKSPYGIGCLQPIGSQLFYVDTMTSAHADNVVLESNNVLEYDIDGVLDPDDIKIRPGVKIPVTKPNSIRPIQLNTQASRVSWNEMSNAVQLADVTVGTGPYIAAGSGRNAERVTAEEVSAQREAGGKRLTTVFAGIERDAMLPLLHRYHFFVRMYYDGRHVVNVEQSYLRVAREAVAYPMRVKSLGASNVASREYDLRQLFDWLQIVQNNPQFAEQVNWMSVLEYMTFMLMPNNAETFLSKPEQAAPQQMPSSPQEQMLEGIQQSAEFVGGQGAVNAVNASAMAGTLPQQLSNALGN
jgi:hypothetical protein